MSQGSSRMTSNESDRSESVQPPRWAEALLRALLGRDDAETVSGDLIEEYRETVCPSRGRRRADVWYVRQVIGFVWRAPLTWGLVFGAFMSGRAVLDAFSPPADWYLRSAVTSWTAIALIVLAGAWSARRTGRVVSGALVALATFLIGMGLAAAFTSALHATVMQHDPEKLRMFQVVEEYERSTRVRWIELLELQLIALAIVAALGTLGGILGKSSRTMLG